MTERPRLPAPPAVEIEVVSDCSSGRTAEEGFLRLRRLTLRNRYADGRQSRAYSYDVIERDAMDAVGLVLEAERQGEPWICLRSSLRPPMAFRDRYHVPISGARSASLWEIPAGLVEPHERGEDGLRACAMRETLEEVGLRLPAVAFQRLGLSFALSPGVLAEQLHLLHAIVDPADRGDPTLDGTPTEERGEVCFVPLREALAALEEGRIADAKTEVALRRLASLRGVR